MAEVIQFPCPACGATLRLPLAMAGIHGPCPRCHQEIIAPVPDLGRAAAILPVAPPISAEPPAAEEIETNPQPAAPPQTTEPPSPARGPHPVTLLSIVLIASTLSLIAGYFIGSRTQAPLSPPPLAITPPAPQIPDKSPAPEPTATPPTEPAPAPAPVEEPQAPEPPPAPVRASAAAEAALKAFLDAPDWSTRAAHTLAAEKYRAAMEDYSHKVPDGPTPCRSISIQNSYTDRKTGNTLFIFQVVTDSHPQGFPVAVVETSSGWLVDWQAFIEFRDDLFLSFADGPPGQTGRFHLIVTTPPASENPKPENEHFTSFLLDPPMPGRQRLAYARKTAPIHATLTAATANATAFTPVLEVAKKQAPDGKTYLEITAIHANDWLPEDR